MQALPATLPNAAANAANNGNQGQTQAGRQHDEPMNDLVDTTFVDKHGNDLVAYLELQGENFRVSTLRERIELNCDVEEIPHPKFIPMRLDTTMPYSYTNSLGIVVLAFETVDARTTAKQIVMENQDTWKVVWQDSSTIKSPDFWISGLPDNIDQDKFAAAVEKAGGTPSQVHKMTFVYENKEKETRDWALWTDGQASEKDKRRAKAKIANLDIVIADGKPPISLIRWEARPHERSLYNFWITGTPDLVATVHFQNDLKDAIITYMAAKTGLSKAEEASGVNLEVAAAKHKGKHVCLVASTRSAKMAAYAREMLTSQELNIHSTHVRYFPSMEAFLSGEINPAYEKATKHLAPWLQNSDGENSRKRKVITPPPCATAALPLRRSSSYGALPLRRTSSYGALGLVPPIIPALMLLLAFQPSACAHTPARHPPPSPHAMLEYRNALLARTRPRQRPLPPRHATDRICPPYMH